MEKPEHRSRHWAKQLAFVLSAVGLMAILLGATSCTHGCNDFSWGSKYGTQCNGGSGPPVRRPPRSAWAGETQSPVGEPSPEKNVSQIARSN